MKDSKFIELLNLYVDHQISASDAAQLEAEIQRNPERRKIYREYCQMQKACAILAESFRPQTQTVGGKVVEFPRRRPSWSVATYVMGAMAAAACVAVVVVNRVPSNGSAEQPETAIVASATEEVAAPAERPTEPAPAPTRPALQPVFAGLVRDNAAPAATTESVSLDWMNQVKLEPVAIENLWFETRPTLHDEHMMLRDGLRPVQREDEVLPVAWRFQR
jgi:Predicted transmembrane transcriptional regulator (anti-sigma factor)